ncbi:5-hydroxytryptamine receptor-like [Mytilus galloprovincialis]|uniref:5-hydroxytryptamine receptor-like n=1 Tax=Mytilus galloprovincialis TaxID=29158 RepID=UPI003F7B80F8
MMTNNVSVEVNNSNIIVTEPNFSLLFENSTQIWNSTENTSTQTFSYVPRYETSHMVIIVIILGCMILSTILGNVFVIAAIVLERSLQGVSNYLILSLAVTDLMVAVLVMPISVVNQVSVFWYLGSELCDMWVSFDVLCCTASILHLVAISLDRFWAVSNIDYIRRRCAKQILIMIVIVWIVSVLISITPLFGWKKEENNPETVGNCLISQDYAYTVLSTVGAFYCPMILMLVLNYKIYTAARSRIRKKHFSSSGSNARPIPCQTITNADVTTHHNSSGSDVSQDGFTVYNGSCINGPEFENTETVPTDYQLNGTGNISDSQLKYLTVPTNVYSFNKPLNPKTSSENNNCSKEIKLKETKEKMRKAKLEMKRERKAARVLGIITGAFIACWLPFFIIAFTAPFCGELCNIPPEVFSIFLWLGYFNSLLNPIIYTVFNPSFRNAFNKLFFKRKRRLR